ncbi:MAG: hypothetical protein WDM88_10405 [Galbitalea sp.]
MLSVFSSFGVVVAIFQWGWFAPELGVIPGPILSFLPINLMAVLFGLAMDYEVFLVSGMRENFVHTGDAKGAIVKGLLRRRARRHRGPRSSCSSSSPPSFPTDSGVIKPHGPRPRGRHPRRRVPGAHDARARGHGACWVAPAWWMPKWLARILPNVDIEGERLREHRDAVSWASGQCSGQIITTSGTRRRIRQPARRSTDPRRATGAPSCSSAATRPIASCSRRPWPAASTRCRVARRSGGHPLPSESGNRRRPRRPRGHRWKRPGRGAGRKSPSSWSSDCGLTQPWYRAFAVQPPRANLARPASTRCWAPDTTNVAPGRASSSSPSCSARSALSAVALAEHTPVVMLDLLDAFADVDEEATFLRAHAPARPGDDDHRASALHVAPRTFDSPPSVAGSSASTSTNFGLRPSTGRGALQ